MVCLKMAREGIGDRLLTALAGTSLKKTPSSLTVLQQSPRSRTGAHCV